MNIQVQEIVKHPAALTVGIVMLGVLGLKTYETLQYPDQPSTDPVIVREFTDEGVVAGVAVDIEEQITTELEKLREDASVQLSEVTKKTRPTGEIRYQVSGVGASAQLDNISTTLQNNGFIELTTDSEAKLFLKNSILCSAAQKSGDVLVVCETQ